MMMSCDHLDFKHLKTANLKVRDVLKFLPVIFSHWNRREMLPVAPLRYPLARAQEGHLRCTTGWPWPIVSASNSMHLDLETIIWIVWKISIIIEFRCSSCWNCSRWYTIIGIALQPITHIPLQVAAFWYQLLRSARCSAAEPLRNSDVLSRSLRKRCSSESLWSEEADKLWKPEGNQWLQ